jgi:hypothetical protein
MREECTLRVSEKVAFGTNREEVVEGWIKLCN